MKNSEIHNESYIEIMKQTSNDFIDLTITSPLYNNPWDYNSHEWSLKVFQQVAEVLYQVMKPGGIIVWVVNDEVEKATIQKIRIVACIYYYIKN